MKAPDQHVSWEEIASNLVAGMEALHEAYSLTHIPRDRRLVSAEDRRRADWLHKLVDCFTSDAMTALEAVARARQHAPQDRAPREHLVRRDPHVRARNTSTQSASCGSE